MANRNFIDNSSSMGYSNRFTRMVCGFCFSDPLYLFNVGYIFIFKHKKASYTGLYILYTYKLRTQYSISCSKYSNDQGNDNPVRNQFHCVHNLYYGFIILS